MINHFYRLLLGKQLNNLPGRTSSRVSGTVNGFLALPVKKGSLDYEVMLHHYQIAQHKEEWIKDKRREYACWIPLINIGGNFLPLDSVALATHGWDDYLKSK